MGCRKLKYYQNAELDKNSFKNVLTLKKSKNKARSSYDYGFNGMERDDAVKGKGNSYTTRFRQYDPRVGRWLTIDPKAKKFPWSSPYVGMGNNPMRFVDPTGMAPDDWVKNKKTGKYVWKNNVTSKSNTPKGFKYIGHNDNDIIKDLFGKNYFTETTIDVGSMSVEQGKNGYAFFNGRIDTKLKITITPQVTTTFKNGTKSKNFNGVKFFASTVSNMYAAIPGGNPKYKLMNSKLSINGKQADPYSCTGDCMRAIGNLPSAYAAFTLKISAKQIQNEFHKSYRMNVKFSGQYADEDGSIFRMPGAFGIFSENRTYINLSIPFSNQ